MKPTHLILALALSLSLNIHNSYADKTDSVDSMQDVKNHTREEFVHGMAQMTLAILQDPKKPLPERRVLLRQAFSTVVDIDWIARFVLGRNWNSASDEQKARYTQLYRAYLSDTYVSNFGENQERRIKDIAILGIQDAEDNGFIVTTDMKLADMEEIKVAYRVSDHAGKYKVIDIIIENVSLLATHRSEFSELAATQGIGGVIARLEHIMDKRDNNALSMSMK